VKERLAENAGAFVADLGRWTLALARYLRESAALLARTTALTLALRGHGLRVVRQVFIMQMLFTGSQAVLPVTVASIAVGTLVVSQAVTYLPSDYVASVTTVVLVREVLPLITAFLVIGRSGTAITIEVGTMRLGDELAALQIMRIPFEHFVLLPRLAGMVASFVILMIYSCVAALAGGYWVWFAVSESPAPWPVTVLLEAVDFSDFVLAGVKVALFGVVVAVTSVQHGLTVQASRREVPIATSRSLVRSTLLCAVINTFVSIVA
jgi:phospholipid/cholesterol/gamma-HCH transport system permease protein